VIDAPLALAFTAGMVAAFNPCGFALLPAYLSFYLGVDGDAPPAAGGAALRGVGVGAAVTAGFVVVFGLAGTAVTQLSLSVQGFAPWLTIVLGAVLVVLGLAMLKGYQPSLALPRLGRLADGRGLGSMFLFGVSYATVSLSCTLPVFLTAVAATFGESSLLAGMVGFVAYALGMGAVLMALTLAVALARRLSCRACAGRSPTSPGRPAPCWWWPAPTSPTTGGTRSPSVVTWTRRPARWPS